MKKIFTFAFLSLSLLFKAHAQNDSVNIETDIVEFDENIVTDRPDQTEAPNLTPKGWFQVEIGAQTEFDQDKIANTKSRSALYNTTLWKYGVSRNFELRLITEFAQDKFMYKTLTNTDTSALITGFAPITIGSKIRICEQRGVRPKISLITHLELPYFGNKAYKPTFIIPRFRFLMAHTLTERISFSYNVGGEWEDGASNATFIYTASLGFNLFKNCNMFVEAYGFEREKTKPDNRLDGGITYLLSNNVQLDVSGGVGLSKISPDSFISCGLSFRLNAFDKLHRKN